MVDIKVTRPQLSLESLKPLLPALVVACAVLVLWFGWSGWQQQRDVSRRATLEQSRDGAVQAITAALLDEQKRFVEQLARPGLVAAATAGDFEHAAELLTSGWPGASDGVVLSPELDAGYAALPKGGYGRLAAMEASLADDKPVVWVLRDGKELKLALAAPVHGDGQIRAVALVHLPLQRVADPVTSAQVPGDTYLALRQGRQSVVERGDARLAGGAEALATKVPGSSLRVAAGVPYLAFSPFGMGAMACFITAFVFALLALLFSRGPALLARRRGAGDEHDDADLPEQTLQESIDQGIPPAAPAPTGEVAGARPVGAVVELDRSIFRAYDIRGVIGQTLDPAVAELIGHAIGSLMHDKSLKDIVVGRDGRLSGPDMVDGLVAGLRKAGRNVIDIGLAPTPLVYFGAFHLRTGSCVSVTGSHNPPDYNGFKIVIGGETLSGDAITDLYARIADDRLYTAPVEGGLELRDINDDYIQRVASDIQIDRPLKVVVDAGNGVAGELGPAVLTAIGAEVIPLYCEIDGTFPNHHPDPSEPHNLVDLMQMVERLDADLGIAFDGDGDRLGVVTRDGHNIFPDRLLMLFAADVLERNPGAQIIFDVKCTGRLPGYILRHGGSPLMWKTGHSLIKSKMRETEAELAGEMSGHFFFKERWYGFDDGIYAAARLLEILAAQPDRPSDVLDALPDGISTPEIKVDAPEGDPHAFVERFLAEATFDAARLSVIDGLRADWPDGWGLVRASNTTPVLVMRFDADNNEAMARIKAAFRGQLLALRPDLELPF
ncbi:phosphomannomutase [Lysobacter concretionis Ko07 = DSM 16239]|uniref:phosphomannomutase n=1 Tax=Lysobacter concretionis Ko07 = DSM 16239 TaxID=1122185 RepID=A0A0A0EJS8_9GAMM|nr:MULTISPECIES: phosphomannomutase/phosphoglucomutase [Lysobacter]KGM51246.1 phosphomannomutase [Lysobacter concretionis Ko07 = DSM 16239]QOD90947.1 phosphomannomutase/phosphoglucomutase [Lysobacter sp. CW239]